MSWEPLVPRRSQGKRNAPQHPITVTCTKGDNYPRRIFVTVRPDLIKDPPEFWKLGQGVTALCGKEEHSGYLRIQSGGSTIIKSSGGSGKTIAAKGLRIMLQVWEGVAPGGHPATPVTEDDHGGDWLEFRLPDWAAQPAAPVASKIAAVPSKDTTLEQQAKPAPHHHGKKAA